MEILLGKERAILLKEKAVWIPSRRSLLLADPHFGKAGHFRKAGIPIAESAHERDYHTLARLLADYRPAHVFFLGDLFHSAWNIQWEALESFLKHFTEATFHLIRGNHDVLPDSVYSSSILQVHNTCVQMGKLCLQHEPPLDLDTSTFFLCGHIHPGVTLKGRGRQRMTMPCFFLKGSTLILPAFGNLTGLYAMKPTPGDRVFLVTPTQVIPMNLSDKVGLDATSR
ncbi:hypothetical protein ADIS_0016 [Lunatimonas lonarensis]|uniref:Calcineurin-like phosphoesterase domain-containing protein n=1 Tax=Lunatimonas lonarensis TaxID=1232681 RepID=R7ZZG8_9BACT|nr:ligase-associated DNA damage response endonuclease PdeM [Lunatimonas lonarensis]EON79449.1 hypothetical protein ADIS_0016 [Lunatimonas lonarensis]